MQELNEEPRDSTEQVDTLESVLAKNWAAARGETESTDSTPDADTGDETSIEAEAETEASEVQESEDALEPLEKWTDSQKELFKSLDPVIQQQWLDREKDVERYLTGETQKLSETRKRYERLDQVVKPYEEVLGQRGIELAPHLANALQYYFAYQQDPASTLKALMKSAGLREDQLLEDDLTDPSIRALRERLDRTERELAQLKGNDTTTAQKQLDDFRSAKNEDGSPKYPHFEQVKALMAPLVAEGKSLEESYSEVLWTMPEHRKAQIEKEKKEALKKVSSEKTKKVQKAKSSETLPSSDVDTVTGLPPMRGNWVNALEHSLSKLGG